ncbi:MAG: hypothetical protein GTN76_04900, partial [Candidatus Aenigmarchaeota archaeon]|nr:hypothetical protein [Candidatus Aenigmarchaeota archaeon]
MLEDVFLTYGNHSLKEDPERLLKMFDEFENVTGFMGECPGNFIYEILSNVITLIKCDSLEIAKERRKKQEFNDREAFETAFEAVYGYRDGYCQKECYTHKTYLTEGNIIANEKFSGPARL